MGWLGLLMDLSDSPAMPWWYRSRALSCLQKISGSIWDHDSPGNQALFAKFEVFIFQQSVHQTAKICGDTLKAMVNVIFCLSRDSLMWVMFSKWKALCWRLVLYSVYCWMVALYSGDGLVQDLYCGAVENKAYSLIHEWMRTYLSVSCAFCGLIIEAVYTYGSNYRVNTCTQSSFRNTT